VRKWVTKEFGDQVLWVEHASGGSVGFPDCVLLMDQMCWPMELKYGNIKNGYWSGWLRSAQRMVGKQFLKHGVKMHILVGSEFEKVLWLCSFEKYFQAGEDDKEVKMEPVSCRLDVVSALSKLPAAKKLCDGLS